MYIIELLCLQMIIVYIIDCSGFIDELKLFISSHLTRGKIKTTNFDLKPFTCSLCLTFWVGIGYLLFTSQFTIINLLIICMLSFLTPVVKDLLFIMRDGLTYLINKLRPNDK